MNNYQNYLIRSFITELAVGNRPAPGPAKVVSDKLSELTTTLEVRERERKGGREGRREGGREEGVCGREGRGRGRGKEECKRREKCGTRGNG